MFGTLVALLISGAFFGGAHIGNPNATLLSSAAIAIEAALLLCFAYTATRSLWLPIGLHAGWNLTRAGFTRLRCPAAKSSRACFSPRSKDPDIITGGAFGPEASVVTLGVCLVLTVIFAVITFRRGEWKGLRLRIAVNPPSWPGPRALRAIVQWRANHARRATQRGRVRVPKQSPIRAQTRACWVARLNRAMTVERNCIRENQRRAINGASHADLSRAPRRLTNSCCTSFWRWRSSTTCRNFPAWTPDPIDDILANAGKFCEEVLQPINQSGDEEGCHFENGVVRTPKGFKEAYKAYREARLGRPWRAGEIRRLGLPMFVTMAVAEMAQSANQAFAMYPGLTSAAYGALIAHRRSPG